MYERLADDRRRLTLSIVEAAGLAFGGESALRTWFSAQAPESVSADPRIAAQRAAIGRLQMLFAHQPNPAFRDAVKVD